MPNFETNPEQENEQERLEKARQELRDFQEEEQTDKKSTAHLTGIKKAEDQMVNLDNLIDEDLKVWLNREFITPEEFEIYRSKIPAKDRDRWRFAAFIANVIFVRFAEAKLKKMREEEEKI